MKKILLLLLLSMTVSCSIEETQQDTTNKTDTIFPGESNTGERLVQQVDRIAYQIVLNSTKEEITAAELMVNPYEDKGTIKCTQSTNANGYTTGVVEIEGSYYYFATNNETHQTYYGNPHSVLFMNLSGWCWAWWTDIVVNRTEGECIDGVMEIEIPCPDGESVGCTMSVRCNEDIEEADKTTPTSPNGIKGEPICVHGSGNSIYTIIEDNNSTYWAFFPDGSYTLINGNVKTACQTLSIMAAN